MDLTQKGHIGWVDALRVIACFLVVFSHCCDPFVAQFNNDYNTFVTGTTLGSLVRCCVPLFVMMSGVLLLPVNTDMRSFYDKRIKRIIVPLIFWSLVLPVAYYLYLANVPTQSPCIDINQFTGEKLGHKLYTFIFNFTYETTPLWYLYMLIGLYLIMPILSAWLTQATRQELKLFLGVWGFTLFLPYLKMVAPLLGYMGNYGHMGLFGECDWNQFGTFYYVSGFIGYLVLAYYLTKYPLDWSWSKMLSITIPMFIVGGIITAYGYILTNDYFPGNYAYLEIIWFFTGINVFMMTFPIFVIVQKLAIKPSATLNRWASLTFGIYLCHFVIVQVCYDLFDRLNLPTVLHIVCMAVTAFTVSAGVVWVMQRFRLTRRLVA